MQNSFLSLRMNECLERVNDRHFGNPGVFSYAIIPRCCPNSRVFFSHHHIYSLWVWASPRGVTVPNHGYDFSIETGDNISLNKLKSTRIRSLNVFTAMSCFVLLEWDPCITHIHSRCLESASCVKISNPYKLSCSEAGVNPGIRCRKKHASEWARSQKAIGGIYFTKKRRAETTICSRIWQIQTQI